MLYSAIGVEEGNYLGALADLVTYETLLLEAYDQLLALVPDEVLPNRDPRTPQPEP